MEKGALQQLNQWEEMPSERPWQQICENLDREQLGRTLHSLEIPPSRTTWEKINQHKRVNRNKMIGAVASITAAIWIAYQVFTPNTKTQETQASLASEKKQVGTETATSSLPPSAKSGLATDKTDEPPKLVQPNYILSASDKLTLNREAKKYVLFAGRNGEPVRVAQQWEKISCCVLGELTSLECDQQRDEWHSELMDASLGFQADPVMGLIALIDRNKSNQE